MKIKDIAEIAAVFIGSGGIVAVVKILFPNLGLKRQKKIELNTELAQKRIEAAKEVKRIEQMANVIEFVNVTHPELFREKGKHESNIVYMSIMENLESLQLFANEINKARVELDDYLSCKVSAYLLYAEKYIFLIDEILENVEYKEDELYILGMLLAPDIQKWQRKLDEILTEEINDAPFCLEAKTGRKWEKEKRKLERKFKKTILYKTKDSSNE